MLSFLFKKKEVVLDCFTFIEHAYQYAPISSAVHHIPNWWKNTQKINNDGNSATIKNCAGFIDHYKKGIVIPSWFEAELTIHEQNNIDNRWWDFKSSLEDNEFSVAGSHHQGQFAGFALDNGHNIKIDSCWIFKTKEEVFFSWTQPTWNMRSVLDHITVLPAVLEFKRQHGTNINLFVTNKLNSVKIIIQPMIPLVMLHPLTERKVTVKNHLVSYSEWNKIAHGGLNKMIMKNSVQNQINMYKKRKQLDKIANERGCPFR